MSNKPTTKQEIIRLILNGQNIHSICRLMNLEREDVKYFLNKNEEVL